MSQGRLIGDVGLFLQQAPARVRNNQLHRHACGVQTLEQTNRVTRSRCARDAERERQAHESSKRSSSVRTKKVLETTMLMRKKARSTVFKSRGRSLRSRTTRC